MTVALIAGTGGLPPHIAGSLMAQGRVPVICEMRGFPSDVKGEFTRIPFRIETLGTFLQALTSLGVTEVCMVGAVQRPDVDPSAIDALTAPLVPRLMAAMAKGDDGTLREIIAIFEEHGFTVIGAHQIAPDLMPVAGVQTNVAPPDLMQDLAVAQMALTSMGQADMGQAMLVRDCAVIAREDARGTAAMLQDFSDPLRDTSHSSGGADIFGLVEDVVGGVADWLSGADDDGRAPGAGAFLYKAPKPDQSLLADMPMIGPDTAMQAAEAGLSGIVIPEGRVMVLDLPQVVTILNAQSMFLWVTP
ncbi:UDP-2,3-diacylglucosamine diphosphatase LpxI [Octadecabacter sp. G9-8]|uniref:UDP-2,3-diacylglucosamine diphosphatase LpxI n=1 Tax=Octadecabacter dasysiphoniae TaxID=2909341 RepID=A0ABS9CW44_9RHOB|nr:UDP-2,3-diacylglucosamine diphosphatase LpxI [Octadecabacter dasysiphoniae]MCF2870584.1 UDP-2,3-diacylglucosamine diphosphatase LpxI [Octadecabacter dasysiphoniae]